MTRAPADLVGTQYMVIVSTIQRYVEWLVTTGKVAGDPRSLARADAEVQAHSKAVNAAMALERLHSVREVPPDAFYNAALSSHINLVQEYTQFMASQARAVGCAQFGDVHEYQAVFSWLRYPYLLTAEAKGWS